MAYPFQHQYMTVIGDAYGGTEKWQFGLRLSDGGVSNQETALAIADDVETFWRGNTPYTSSSVYGSLTSHRLTELKVARIGTDGLYPAGQESYSHFYLPPIAGAAAPPAGLVPQATMAVTLLTAKPRGLASKGRIYLPPSNEIVPAADGLIPTTMAQRLANGVWQLIQAINANTVVGNVLIVSRGKGVARYDAEHKRVEYDYPNEGTSEVVTGTKVGRVVDTQRRRRRQLGEQYLNDTN